MTRAVTLAFCSLAVAACGTDAKSSFSQAELTIDKTKLMDELTGAERTSMCDELSRSLTASFGPKDVACAFGSHSGTREGSAQCEGWYDQCVNDPTPVAPISGCTDQMADMWSCPITAGQYEACFNAFNSGLLDFVVSEPVCQASSSGPLMTPEECVTAQCDYLWFD